MTDGPLDGLSDGQELALVISIIALIGVVVISDIFARAIATSGALRSHLAPLAAVSATWVRPGKDPDLSGTVLAARGGDLGGGGGGELLFVLDEPENGAPRAQWLSTAVVRF